MRIICKHKQGWVFMTISKAEMEKQISRNLRFKTEADNENRRKNIDASIKCWNERLPHFPDESILPLQEKAIRTFWKRFTEIETVEWVKYYSCRNGTFDTRYIPDGIFYSFIDPYFNNYSFADIFDNKAYYSLIFTDVLKPDILAVKINNVWLDQNYSIISIEDVINRCINEGRAVIKPARCSSGGFGITFWDNSQSFEVLKQSICYGAIDITIQKLICQHDVLNKINDTSVNTIRFMTLLYKNEIFVLSSVLRMGINGARVDNASAGGITCGFLDGGRIKQVAFNKDGVKYDKHPQGTIFSNVIIPGFDKAKKMVCKLQARFPYCAMISWDIAINRNAEPVLIEANLANGQLDFHQLNNGPIFGDLTENILNSVFTDK